MLRSVPVARGVLFTQISVILYSTVMLKRFAAILNICFLLKGFAPCMLLLYRQWAYFFKRSCISLTKNIVCNKLLSLFHIKMLSLSGIKFNAHYEKIFNPVVYCYRPVRL